MRNRIFHVLPVLLCLVLVLPFKVQAEKGGTQDSFDSIEAIILILKEKGILTDKESTEFIRRYREGALPKGVSTPQKIYIEQVKDEVSEEVKEEVREDVKKEIVRSLANRASAYSSNWANRVRWGGDIRIRYQGDLFGEDNVEDLVDPQDPGNTINTTEDRHRGRIRVRIGARALINEQVEAGVRLATGNEDNPVSTNDNLGDYNTRDTVTFDQAYLKWEPWPDNPFTAFKAWAGRIPNPFFSTSLVWDSDLHFEGAAVNYKTQLTPMWDGFVNAGFFSIQEVERWQDDKWMYGAQAGLEYTIEDFVRDIDTVSAKLGVAFYDYMEIEGVREEVLGDPAQNDPSLPPYLQKGNTLFNTVPSVSGRQPEYGLASDFDQLSLTGQIDIGIYDPVHIILTADYVKNIGYDEERIREIDPDWEEEAEGYSLSLSVGNPKVRVPGDWRCSVGFKHLERDAVLDAFTDSDFHLGGTNAEGWYLRGEIGLLTNVWLTGRWISADQISDKYQPWSDSEGPLAVDTFQLDLNAVY